MIPPQVWPEFHGIYLGCLILAGLMVGAGTYDAFRGRSRMDRRAGAVMALAGLGCILACIVHTLRQP